MAKNSPDKLGTVRTAFGICNTHTFFQWFPDLGLPLHVLTGLLWIIDSDISQLNVAPPTPGQLWKPGCGDPGLGVFVSQDVHTPLDLVNVFCCPVSIDSSLITTPQYPSGEPPQYTFIPSTSDGFGSFKMQNIWLRSGQSGCLSSLARDPIWLSQRE